MEAAMDTARPCTIAESLKQSCQEVRLMCEGKIPKRRWDDFKQRMEKEMAEGE